MKYTVYPQFIALFSLAQNLQMFTFFVGTVTQPNIADFPHRISGRSPSSRPIWKVMCYLERTLGSFGHSFSLIANGWNPTIDGLGRCFFFLFQATFSGFEHIITETNIADANMQINPQ